MTNLTSISLVNGIPSTGTGTVSTIDNLLATTTEVTQDTTVMGIGAGATATPVKTKVYANTAGATTVVALTGGKKQRVLAAYLVANGAVIVNWQSHTTTTNADGVQSYANTGGIVLPFNPVGWFDTTSGEALDINLSAAIQVGGLVVTIPV